MVRVWVAENCAIRQLTCGPYLSGLEIKGLYNHIKRYINSSVYFYLIYLYLLLISHMQYKSCLLYTSDAADE